MPWADVGPALQLATAGLRNLLLHKPLGVSFEVTHSCNANCKHCDKGGRIPEEKLAPPEEFERVAKELKPVVAQISGGEPLLRKDVIEIVRRIKGDPPRAVPYVVFVTNGSLLTEEKYHALKEAGVDEFSVSLDFPDERHDRNRGIPGLYEHLNRLLPRLARNGCQDILLISVIRKETVADLPRLLSKAHEWGVAINFSAYTPLRTGRWEHMVDRGAQWRALGAGVEQIIRYKRQSGRVFTSERVLRRYVTFFRRRGYPGCRAGIRSLVVNPDATLSPCAMYPELRFRSQKELVEEFTRKNRCDGCLVSLRANTEKPIRELFLDAVELYRQKRRFLRNGRAC